MHVNKISGTHYTEVHERKPSKIPTHKRESCNQGERSGNEKICKLGNYVAEEEHDTGRFVKSGREKKGREVER